MFQDTSYNSFRKKPPAIGGRNYSSVATPLSNHLAYAATTSSGTGASTGASGGSSCGCFYMTVGGTRKKVCASCAQPCRTAACLGLEGGTPTCPTGQTYDAVQKKCVATAGSGGGGSTGGTGSGGGTTGTGGGSTGGGTTTPAPAATTTRQLVIAGLIVFAIEKFLN